MFAGVFGLLAADNIPTCTRNPRPDGHEENLRDFTRYDPIIDEVIYPASSSEIPESDYGVFGKCPEIRLSSHCCTSTSVEGC